MAVVAFFRSGRKNAKSQLISDQVDVPKKIHLELSHLVIIVASLILIGSVIYASVTPRPTINTTEFYVLNSDGTLPFSITDPIDSELDLILGIGNYEGRDTEYRLEIIAKSGTSELSIWEDNKVVSDESTGEIAVNLPPLPSQTRELILNLYIENESNPYRSLNIIIEP